MMRSIALAAFGLSLVLAGVAYASSAAGLYVLVEEVELGPGKEPQWIKIRGVFMNEPSSSDPSPTEGYGPKQGWVHFRLPARKQELARLEWKDFTSAKGKVVAFGSAYAPRLNPASIGRSVSADKAQATAIAYPVDHGMYLLRDDSKPAEDLRAFQGKNPPRK